MRTLRSLAALLVALSVLTAVPSAAGTFNDRDGGTHKWAIDEGHALVWDGAPYVPFGVVFEPRYLSGEQTDANFTADEQDVLAFKLAGVTDIIIRPSKGLTTVPATAIQRVIDLLEKNAMRYGLELYDQDYASLTGYVVQPKVNRVDNITASGDVTYNLPNADVAIYVLCEGKTGEVRDYGRKAVADGQIVVPSILRTPGSHVMLYFPRQAVSGAGLFDVWGGFDQHRDRLIVLLKQVKFGKGLRFFIDPFGESFGIGGDVDTIVPNSTAFRFEYAAWLSKRYNSPGDLNIAWGILKHDVNSFDEATRLIPLWRDGRGAPIVYDDGMSKSYPADTAKSSIWEDLRLFREDSVRGYMDAMADVAKRVAADVPVIYSVTGLQSIFQASGSIGYDGLVMQDADSKQGTILNSGRALSLAESSARRMWLVSHLRPSGKVYEKKDDLFGAMNTAHGMGAKGFFVDDARETGVDGANLVSWLAEYGSLSANDKLFATYKPRVVYHPDGISNTGIKKLSNGSWWLPSLQDGHELYLGDTLSGYAVVDQRTYDPTICLWSLKGSQAIHIVSHPGMRVMNASGVLVDAKPKKGRVEIVVGDEPVFVHGIAPDQFLPIEIVMQAIDELQKAIDRGEQKRMDTSDYKSKLKNAQAMLNANQLSICLDLLHESTAEINQRMRGLDVIPQIGADKTSGR